MYAMSVMNCRERARSHGRGLKWRVRAESFQMDLGRRRAVCGPRPGIDRMAPLSNAARRTFSALPVGRSRRTDGRFASLSRKKSYGTKLQRYVSKLPIPGVWTLQDKSERSADIRFRRSSHA